MTATDKNVLNSIVIDGVSQTNLTVLGNNPALALAQASLSLTNANSVLFANMVSSQQQQSMVNNTVVSQGVKLLTKRKGQSNEVSKIESAISDISTSMKTLSEKSF